MISSLAQNITWLAAIVAVGAVSRRMTPRRSSPVVGELLGGMILGNLALFGVLFFEPMKLSRLLEVLAQLGISFLLFQIGCESTVVEMRRVGFRALGVALTGVSCTFLLGVLFVPRIIGGLDDRAVVFISAALTATSVGITARVLKDLGKSKTAESQIIIGAAAIDDVLSLLLLVVTTTLIETGSSAFALVAMTALKVAVFILAGILLGELAARHLPRLLLRMYPHIDPSIGIAFLFFAVFGLTSVAVGLPPIIGSFIGGLVIDRKHLAGDRPGNWESAWARTERVLDRTAEFVVPFFFVMTGLRMEWATVFSLQTVVIAVGLAAVAVTGKLACGLAAGKGINRWLIGFGMVPRGEVQLIYANVGLGLAVLSTAAYSSIIVVVLLTTILAPVVLTSLARAS